MIAKTSRALLFSLLFCSFGYAVSGTTPTENSESAGADVIIGDKVAGEERYKKSCVNCHGAAGMGIASYPKISGQEIAYTTSKLETYREGTKIGPNSSLMIMMAKPLTDQEIADLSVYLKDAPS